MTRTSLASRRTSSREREPAGKPAARPASLWQMKAFSGCPEAPIRIRRVSSLDVERISTQRMTLSSTNEAPSRPGSPQRARSSSTTSMPVSTESRVKVSPRMRSALPILGDRENSGTGATAPSRGTIAYARIFSRSSAPAACWASGEPWSRDSFDQSRTCFPGIETRLPWTCI